MSYYHYMQSVYTSTLPELNRTLRSSSVARSSSVTRTTSTSEMPSRFTRASTVGPTDFKYNYVSAMPFTFQYESAVQRILDRNIRATTVAPSSISSRTYSDAYTRARDGGYSAFDYKVGIEWYIMLVKSMCIKCMKYGKLNLTNMPQIWGIDQLSWLPLEKKTQHNYYICKGNWKTSLAWIFA